MYVKKSGIMHVKHIAKWLTHSKQILLLSASSLQLVGIQGDRMGNGREMWASEIHYRTCLAVDKRQD